MSPYASIWRVVSEIPPGRVATYGQVAALAGRPGAARQVGYALARLPDESEVPWHRVVNARGEVSPRPGAPWASSLQRALLEDEGVAFDADGRLDFDTVRWRPAEEGNG